MSVTAAIEVEDLHKTYREGLVFRKTFAALKGISLQVPEGEIFGLLGPNGAGKTTLVKILLGIISRTRGKASMLGLPAGSLRSRRKVGYLPEHLRMAPHLTPYSAMEVYGSLAGLPNREIRKHRDRLLEQVGLGDWKRERIRKFSKGMLQRLGLAQALLNQPRLLFLDEPTDGLDPRARAEMREIIRSLCQQGVTIFLNSHLLQEVEMICRQVAILNRGELKYCGPVNEAAQHARTAGGLHSGWTVEIGLVAPGLFRMPTTEDLQPKVEDQGGGARLVRIDVSSQAQVDWFVDQLRLQGASLTSLRKLESSLEDAFLAMVEE